MNNRPRSGSNTGPNRSAVNRIAGNKIPVKIGPFTGSRPRSMSNGNMVNNNTRIPSTPSPTLSNVNNNNNNNNVNNVKSPYNNIPNSVGNPKSPVYYNKQTEELLKRLNKCQELVTRLQTNSKNSSKTLEESS